MSKKPGTAELQITAEVGRRWTRAAMAKTRPSARAGAIAMELLRTGHAIGGIYLEYGMLRLECRIGGSYWISHNGSRVYQGKTLFAANSAQSAFIDAMSRLGRRCSLP
jgi:hypothetical protein